MKASAVANALRAFVAARQPVFVWGRPGAGKSSVIAQVAMSLNFSMFSGWAEPVGWEAYPHHQFIHTVGALDCCRSGGCWRSRTLPLGDGDEKDSACGLCVNVAGQLPRCMHMIRAADVIRRIQLYFDGGAAVYLDDAVRGVPESVGAPSVSTRITEVETCAR